MQIVEKGLIQLDDDVRPLVPELASAQVLRGFDDDDKPILEKNDSQSHSGEQFRTKAFRPCADNGVL